MMRERAGTSLVEWILVLVIVIAVAGVLFYAAASALNARIGKEMH